MNPILSPAVLPIYVEWFVRLLAVVGGAAAGGGGVHFFLRRLAKRLPGKDAPPGVVFRGVRLGGAVAGGMAVWYLISALGFLGPGPGGPGPGSGPGLGGPDAASPHAAEKTKPGPTQTSADNAEVLRVTLLGGKRVENERFYSISGEARPLNLTELKQLIRERERKKSIRGLELVIYEDSVAEEHPAVRELRKWAQENNLSVTVSFPSGTMP